MLARAVVVLGLAMSFARSAHAERRTTVMVEPLYLVIAMVDSTIEYEPTPRVGIAAIAGYGRPIFGAALYDLGVQGNVYLQHDFSGLHLGSEIRYLWGSLSVPFVDTPMSDSRERVVGLYAGYKWVASYGLTAVLQLGVGQIAVRGPDPMSRIIPVGNMNVGWSF